MTVSYLTPELRSKDAFHHIDMGFLNRRLAMTVLPPPIREAYLERAKQGADEFTRLGNDHLLVTMLLDVCDNAEVPTLLEALEARKPRMMFRSTERLHASAGGCRYSGSVRVQNDSCSTFLRMTRLGGNGRQ
jgi:hypothetical protein